MQAKTEVGQKMQAQGLKKNASLGPPKPRFFNTDQTPLELGKGLGLGKGKGLGLGLGKHRHKGLG